VVSGQDEARLTVLGIVRGFENRAGPFLAFDIGGGSTEFIRARDGRMEVAVSLTLGVVPLAERYPFPDRVDRHRYRALEDEIHRRLVAELPPAIRRAGVPDLIGTAGTVTTLAALDLGLAQYDPTRVHGHRLDRAAIERLRDRLGALTVEERAALPCLEPGRADLIVPGVAIVLAALDATGTAAVVVSDWGLREGIMAEALAR
jgi:exopolyphosphatase/guanosine-5'-triphosphate,3'-diphosphate pyrophosphatase